MVLKYDSKIPFGCCCWRCCDGWSVGGVFEVGGAVENGEKPRCMITLSPSPLYIGGSICAPPTATVGPFVVFDVPF